MRNRLTLDELRVETFVATPESDEQARREAELAAFTTTFCVATGIDSTCRCCSAACG
jgi:hypothetical protein